MASKRFEKGSEEWQMFREYWALCQQFWEPEDNDEYWERVIEDTDNFYKKYRANNGEFAKGIALAFIDMLDKKSRKKRKHEGIPMPEKYKERLEDMRNE